MYRSRMRALFPVLLLMLLTAPVAGAETPQERAYVAERQSLVAALEAKYKSLPRPIDEAAWHREEMRVQELLMARLRELIGPAPLPKGFAVQRSNPDPVCCGVGAGSLDALVVSNGRIRAVMTTEGIMRLWLRGDPVSSLQRDNIDYDAALNADANVDVFAPLPVTARAGVDLALGRLVIKGQGPGRLPLHVVGGVVARGRVMLALVPASLEAANAGSPCEVLWQESSERYRTADDLDTRRSISVETGQQFAQCVKEHAGRPVFPGLGRRAQRLIDTLSAE